VIKALFLIFEPVRTWEGIQLNRRSFGFILWAYLMPMIILSCVAEGYGLHRWGRPQGELSHHKDYPLGETVIFEFGQAVLSLAVVFIGAKLTKSVGETFHGRHTYTQTFSAVAYGLSPLFLLRLLDMSPSFSPWVTWAIGILLSIAVLYQGLPRMMEPDPPHAFGLFLMSSLLLVFISGLWRFMAAWYLQGKFATLEAHVASLAAHLPFK
jgi:hypothetical protein